MIPKQLRDIAIFGAFPATLVLAGAISYAVSDDVIRIYQLDQLKFAMERHYANAETYVLPAGSDGRGQGWVNFHYDNSPSIESFLNTAYLDTGELIYRGQQLNYMLYVCGDSNRFTLWATIRRPSLWKFIGWPYGHTPIKLSDGCNANGDNGAVSKYGKNYAVGN